LTVILVEIPIDDGSRIAAILETLVIVGSAHASALKRCVVDIGTETDVVGSNDDAIVGALTASACHLLL